MRKFLCLCASMLLFLGACTLFCSCDGRGGLQRAIGNNIAVHSEDNEESTVIGYLSQGQVVEVTSEGLNNWNKIRYGNGEGYVYAQGMQWIKENGEIDYSLRWGMLEGFGIGAGIIVVIVVGLILIGLLVLVLRFLLGLLLKTVLYAISGGALAGLIGAFVTDNFDAAIVWVKWGGIIGIAVALIRIVKNPFKAADEGIRDTVNDINDIKQKQQKEELEKYPIELGDGVRAMTTPDGTLLDNKGRKWIDNGDGTVYRIE